MAFVDHDQVKEVRGELLVHILDVIAARHRLVQRQVNILRDWQKFGFEGWEDEMLFIGIRFSACKDALLVFLVGQE